MEEGFGYAGNVRRHGQRVCNKKSLVLELYYQKRVTIMQPLERVYCVHMFVVVLHSVKSFLFLCMCMYCIVLPNFSDDTMLLFVTGSLSERRPFILQSASLQISGSKVEIKCEFDKNSKYSSCVLIYREYGNETIRRIEYPQSSAVFPVTLTAPTGVGSWCNHTFALFGKNSSNFDERPIATLVPCSTSTPLPHKGLHFV